jgi:hypothetical protein
MKLYEDRDAVKSYFIEAYPKRWVNPHDAEMIFVVGSGKCATTTMTHLMNLSNSMLSYHEFAPRLWHLSNEVYHDRCKNPWWDKIYWAARRDIISVLNENELIYGENNHRVSPFLPGILRLMPKTKVVILWRDFDETIISGCRWGWYSKYDRTAEGRMRPLKPLGDIRHYSAWYWCAIYEYLLDTTKNFKQVVAFSFEHIKSGNIRKIQELFWWLNVRVPEKNHIATVLNRKYNSAVSKQPVECNWDHYREKAVDIQKRLLSIGI